MITKIERENNKYPACKPTWDQLIANVIIQCTMLDVWCTTLFAEYWCAVQVSDTTMMLWKTNVCKSNLFTTTFLNFY